MQQRICLGMQKDMNLTVRKFFDSVYEYTDKIFRLYDTPFAHQMFPEWIKTIKRIQRQIEEMSETDDVMEKYNITYKVMTTPINPYLFIKPNSADNQMYHAFIDVLRGITEYYRSANGNGDYPNMILMPLKQWYYKLSKNPLKDFYFQFLPLSYFSVKKR